MKLSEKQKELLLEQRETCREMIDILQIIISNFEENLCTHSYEDAQGLLVKRCKLEGARELRQQFIRIIDKVAKV